MRVFTSSVIVLAGALMATAFTVAESSAKAANDDVPPPQHGEHEPTPIPLSTRRRPRVNGNQD